MASRRLELVLALILAAALAGRASAQSGCTTTLMNLAPCLNYITGNTSTPSPTCCSQLSSVVQVSPACLCSVVNGAAASMGIAINQTLALSLPGACQVSTPPLSQCQAATEPTSSTSPPESSPADSPTEAALTPPASDVPSLGGGSKSVPSTRGGSSSGSGAKSSTTPVALFLFLVLSSSPAIVAFRAF